jgi:uncharacterized repeat protein (TIGR03803 family)
LGNLGRFALIASAAVLFAGCGRSQSPIGAPGAIPQSRPVAEGVRDGAAALAPKAGIASYAPDIQLVAVNGELYGATSNGGMYSGGTAFSITTSGAEKVLYNFGNGSDGAGPTSMISVDGKFYGTTLGGGAYGKGTVFSLTTSGEEHVLYSFGNSPDANAPTGLTNIHGTLYGTAVGGAYNFGTVFSITINGVEKVVHSFGQGCGASCAGGSYPQGGLLEIGKRLYGATYGGGADNAGVVFSMSKKTGQTNVLYSFSSGSGSAEAYGSLIDVDGLAYGTTAFGGKYGDGSIYRVSTNGTAKVLHNFEAGCKRRVDGQLPRAPLIDVNGTLYGTTWEGGSDAVCYYFEGSGTVFSATRSGKVKVLHTFALSTGGDGSSPAAAPTELNGVLYGTTHYGGACGLGTVYSITLSGSEKLLYSFC